MKKLLTLTFVLLGTLAAVPAFAQDYDYKFSIVNRTDDGILEMNITGIYLSRTDESDWGENKIPRNPDTGEYVLEPGWQANFYMDIDDCVDDNFDFIYYDIKIVDDIGDECIIFGQDVCYDENDDDDDPNTIKIILDSQTLLDCQGY